MFPGHQFLRGYSFLRLSFDILMDRGGKRLLMKDQ